MLKTAKVALITGAARRVGAEIARALHAAGYNVVLHYNHSGEEAEQLSALFNQQRPHSAMTLKGDLSDLTQTMSLAKQAEAVWGRLDILVNNASRFYKTHVGTVTEASWDDLMNTNLKAPFFLCQAAREYLDKQQGCIVNIADVHAERPMHDYAVYCISKAGLVMLTQALAKELGPSIRVNAVAPGTVVWPEGENQLNDELKQKIMQRTALHRHGSAEDIAKAVLYLVRDADYVTGEVLTVDGGRSLHI
jgi:pteridine reductase